MGDAVSGVMEVEERGVVGGGDAQRIPTQTVLYAGTGNGGDPAIRSITLKLRAGYR